MMCTSMTHIKYEGRQLFVPCKKCIPCKINKTSEWTLRILMELQYWQSAVFVTLTYNQDNLPANGSLSREVLSDFFKSLRQNLNGRKIKYYACGEYGDSDNTERPHYHCIIFGVSDSLEDRKALFNSWKNCDDWMFFGKTWFKTVGTVTKDSAQYVSGYCQKKLFGDLALEEYDRRGRNPPFQTQSNGIGERYFLDNYDLIKKDGFIFFDGVNHPIPETFKRKFGLLGYKSETTLEYIKKSNYDLFIQLQKIQPDLQFSDLGSERFNFFQLYKFTDINNQTVKELIETKNNLRRKKL